VIWMRIKKPNATRTYRAWGYPVTPLIFIVFSIYVLFFQIQEKPKEFFLGLGTLAIGAVVYFLVRRGKSSNS
ncbi:hypothetical protein OAL55_02965, partial [Verrucomicrobiales bacterium]|nr:hypothetical protein [Verrucomicrobiales bacterium]